MHCLKVGNVTVPGFAGVSGRFFKVLLPSEFSSIDHRRPSPFSKWLISMVGRDPQFLGLWDFQMAFPNGC